MCIGNPTTTHTVYNTKPMAFDCSWHANGDGTRLSRIRFYTICHRISNCRKIRRFSTLLATITRDPAACSSCPSSCPRILHGTRRTGNFDFKFNSLTDLRTHQSFDCILCIREKQQYCDPGRLQARRLWNRRIPLLFSRVHCVVLTVRAVVHTAFTRVILLIYVCGLSMRSVCGAPRSWTGGGGGGGGGQHKIVLCKSVMCQSVTRYRIIIFIYIYIYVRIFTGTFFCSLFKNKSKKALFV